MPLSLLYIYYYNTFSNVGTQQSKQRRCIQKVSVQEQTGSGV